MSINLSTGTDFVTLYLNELCKGRQWLQTSGCILVIYGYFVSNKKLLWKVLLWHGISGLMAILVESFFVAKKGCCSSENWSFLLGFNEISWIIHEYSTVIYSAIKLETILMKSMHKKILRGILGVCFFGFSVFRVLNGIARVQTNDVNNSLTRQAHSDAFLFWGIADMVILVLLVMNAINIKSDSFQTNDPIVSTLFKSSIPRLLIIVINTLILVVVGYTYRDHSPSGIAELAWAIKGSYAMILLFDMHTTKDMLLAASNDLVTSKNTTDR
ncbi:hypothetical protein HDV02_001513 [Globomyces sp. JEL0801]|nr:hypothetical protein HDV02_001513 [Globomyces sp. JEL0801]